MSSIDSTIAARNKKFNTLYLTDEYDNSLLLVRSWNRKGFYNIARYEVFTDGKVANRDGLIPDATFFTNEEVADMLTKSEERERRLENIESLMKEWIRFRQSWSAKSKSKHRKVSRLQKQEVAK